MTMNFLSTFEDYAAGYLPEEVMNGFRELSERKSAGALSDNSYCEAVKDFVIHSIPDEILNNFTKFLQVDFEMPDCLFTRHFIARLFSRFSESCVYFLMERIRKLFFQCCRTNRERSRGDGLVLVVDPAHRELITIFAR